MLFIIELLLTTLSNILRVLELCIFLAVIFSWFIPSSKHPIILFVRKIANPILRIAKKITPNTGMIDLSPIIAIIGVSIAQGLVRFLLRGIENNPEVLPFLGA
jgi:YggT family protein